MYYLSGLFKSELWDEVILRATHHSDAIRHAVVGLGSLHETLQSRTIGSDSPDYTWAVQLKDEKWALQQYNKAIRSLTQVDLEGERPPIDVVLAACLLFCCFEVAKVQHAVEQLTYFFQILRRHSGMAVTHLKSGIKIIADHQAQMQSPRRGPEMVPFKHLIAVFTRLETQLCELSEPPPRIPPCRLFHAAHGKEELWKVSTPHFEDLKAAWIVLNHSWHVLEHFLHDAKDHDETGYTMPRQEWVNRRDALLQSFSNWDIALTGLKEVLSTQPEPSLRDARAAALLEVHYILGAQILELAEPPHDQTIWDELETGTKRHLDNHMLFDQFQPGFERVVELAAIVSGESEGSGTEPPVLSLDMGIVPPMFRVIWNCRDARTRYKAIRILESCPRLEGLWDGLLTARVGRRIDEIERCGESLESAAERGATCDDIPQWARVLFVDVHFSGKEREMDMTYLKAQSDVDATVVAIKETLRW